MQTNCPQCAKLLTIDDALAGKRVRCPQCQQAFVVGGLLDKPPVHDAPKTPLQSLGLTSRAKPSLGKLMWAFAILSVLIGLLAAEAHDSQQLINYTAAVQLGESVERPTNVVIEPSYFMDGLFAAWCFAVLAILFDIRDRIITDTLRSSFGFDHRADH